MKCCPKCGGKSFRATATVLQGWIVDSDGEFVEEYKSCIDVCHAPDDSDIWVCDKCGYKAEGAAMYRIYDETVEREIDWYSQILFDMTIEVVYASLEGTVDLMESIEKASRLVRQWAKDFQEYYDGESMDYYMELQDFVVKKLGGTK